MARMKTGWVITATLDENTKYMFYYDTDTLESALESFYYDDYCEYLLECDNSDEFPIDCKAVGIPDNDAMIEDERSLKFHSSLWHQYFDKGWDNSSKEPGKVYKFKQFLKDISYGD